MRTCPNCGLGTLEPIATIQARDAAPITANDRSLNIRPHPEKPGTDTSPAASVPIDADTAACGGSRMALTFPIAHVSEFIGMGANGITGDYSRGVAGFMIENGELTYPVSEVTVAGNLKDMFRRATAADDLVFKYGTDAPTLPIAELTVAGK